MQEARKDRLEPCLRCVYTARHKEFYSFEHVALVRIKIIGEALTHGLQGFFHGDRTQSGEFPTTSREPVFADTARQALLVRSRGRQETQFQGHLFIEPSQGGVQALLLHGREFRAIPTGGDDGRAAGMVA